MHTKMWIRIYIDAFNLEKNKIVFDRKTLYCDSRYCLPQVVEDPLLVVVGVEVTLPRPRPGSVPRHAASVSSLQLGILSLQLGVLSLSLVPNVEWRWRGCRICL